MNSSVDRDLLEAGLKRIRPPENPLPYSGLVQDHRRYRSSQGAAGGFVHDFNKSSPATTTTSITSITNRTPPELPSRSYQSSYHLGIPGPSSASRSSSGPSHYFNGERDGQPVLTSTSCRTSNPLGPASYPSSTTCFTTGFTLPMNTGSCSDMIPTATDSCSDTIPTTMVSCSDMTPTITNLRTDGLVNKVEPPTTPTPTPIPTMITATTATKPTTTTTTNPSDTDRGEADMTLLPPDHEHERTDRMDDDKMISFIRMFYSGHLRPQEESKYMSSLLNAFHSLFDKHGRINCVPLRIASVSLGSEGIGGKRSMEEEEEDERLLTIGCKVCLKEVITTDVPFIPRSYTDFTKALLTHIDSAAHHDQIRLDDKLDAIFSQPYREPKRKRSVNELSAGEDASDDEAEIKTSKRSRRRSALDPDGDSDDNDDDRDGQPASTNVMTDNIKANLDVTASDLSNEESIQALARMSFGESAKTFQTTPPDLSLVKWQGRIRDVAEARRIFKIESEVGSDDQPILLPGMCSTLLPSQVTAAASIWACLADHPGFLLCDGVGMGKTCAALTVLIKDVQLTPDPIETLILCPEGLQEVVWKAEIERHFTNLISHVKVIKTEEDWKRLIDPSNAASRERIVIVSYTLLQRTRRSSSTYIDLLAFKPKLVIADETQKLANSRTQVSKDIIALCNSTPFTIAISATPTPGSCRDIWSSLRMIGALQGDKPFGIWVRSVPKQYSDQLVKLQDWLRQPWYISRQLSEFPGMQAITSNPTSQRSVKCTPNGPEATVLRVLQSMIEQAIKTEQSKLGSKSNADLLESSSVIFELLEGMRRLVYSYECFRQWYRRPDTHTFGLPDWCLEDIDEAILAEKRTIKMRSVIQWIKTALDQNARAKILVVGRDELFIAPLIDCFGPEFTDGMLLFDKEDRSSSSASSCWLRYDSTLHDRDSKNRVLENFVRDDRNKVLLGPIASLAEGKNLQRCTHLYFVDVPRSETSLVQTEGRLIRPGQTNSVSIKRFITTKSPDVLYEVLTCHDRLNLGNETHPYLSLKQANRMKGLY